ncbi:MAG: ribonuclease E/G [Paracoccus denitrificans]|nr:MAG: ribonuclease E/G [Paracoccus denitrificans]PZO83913.1 MAG: ribonuclease E/G [Paracoccus denitrificans]
MAKKMLIDATHAEETRVVVVDGTKVEEFDFETLNKRQLAGNIYLAKVTRVEPSLQAAFVDYGGNRHGFLAFAEIHPDYYQIPAADRQALIEEERAAQEEAEAEETAKERRGNNRNRRRGGGDNRQSAQAEAVAGDAVARSEDVPGMEVSDSNVASDDADAVAVTEADAVSNDAPDAAVDAAVEQNHDDAHATEADAVDDADTDGDDDNDEDTDTHPDDEIESVAEEDVTEEVRPVRKPRARRYKIQEVIKVRQIMLVQVVKEERGNKGAALTTYLSLAGRYCVLMPNTARGGGISRKITNVADRKKLKEIASQLEVPQGAGLIIRTAGSQRTDTEIRRDYEYLMRLWEQIRDVTFKSTAPAPIYEEGDLIKRTIRDLYSKEIDEVLVEGERGYATAKDFMKMIMPTHAKAVKQYTDPMPMFARYQVEGYLGGMFNPVVQLKSGGYIVIGITEALVAIDVNSGRATKEGSIEDTAFKTNCEAADEIARQLRLRDLAGLIVIDFIDMDERKNNAAVEKRFKERLKVDRARIQVGRISGFGLLEMSRQRLRPGMLESTTQPCPHCHGTGLIRSDDSMALTILRAIEEEGTRKRSREVLVKAPIAVANFLMNQKREHIGMIEQRFGLAVRVEADPTLISPDFALEKFKTATRNLTELHAPVLSVDASLMAQIDDEDDHVEDGDAVEDDADVTEAHSSSEAASDDNGNDDDSRSRKRRRRRRRGGRNGDASENDASENGENGDAVTAEGDSSEALTDAEVPAAADADAEAEPKQRSRRRSRGGRSRRGEDTSAPVVDQSDDAPAGEGFVVQDGAAADAGSTAEETAPADLTDAEAVADASDDTIVPLIDAVAPDTADATPVEVFEPQAGTPAADLVAEPAEVEQAPEPDVAPTPKAETPAPAAETTPAPKADNEAAEPAETESTKPKRRGWWSFGG